MGFILTLCAYSLVTCNLQFQEFGLQQSLRFHTSATSRMFQLEILVSCPWKNILQAVVSHSVIYFSDHSSKVIFLAFLQLLMLQD